MAAEAAKQREARQRHDRDGSLASQTLFPRVGGRGRKCGGEKGSGVYGPYSVTTWNAIIGRVMR